MQLKIEIKVKKLFLSSKQLKINYVCVDWNHIALCFADEKYVVSVLFAFIYP